MTATEELQAKDTQRKAAKKELQKAWATFEDLESKPKAFEEFPAVLTPGRDPVWLRFEAIGSEEYDDLLTKHPPTTAQKARGLTYNPKTFAPALLSQVGMIPKLSAEQWARILKSDGWSGGESGSLYDHAIQLCVKGLDPGPIEAD